MKIGFIGLGHMGQPMAQNCLKHGHQLTVFDKQEQVCQSLQEQGARLALSAGEAACQQDVVITMLQTHDQVADCCLQENGIFDCIESESAIYLDCSTVSITASRDLHAQAKKRGITMLDAPVSGGVAAAKAGQLTFMVGGDEEVFTQVKELLMQMGKAAIFAGGVGNGTAAKICNNLILGISMIAVSESFTLAKALGLSDQTLFDICSQASGQCWSLTSYCPAPGILDNVPSNNDYEPGFAAAMMLKDLKLAQEASQTTSTSSVLGEQAKKLYEKFVDAGHAEKDFSGIIQMLSE